MAGPKLPLEIASLSLPIQGFQGLSLKLDFANRSRQSFQQLDNVDLYTPGSLRKVLPAVLYGGPYGAVLLNAVEYLAQPNNPNGGIRRLLGIGADGKLYNLASATPATPYLDTSALLGVPSSIPHMYQVPGFFVPFNVRSWQASTVYALNDAVLEYSPADGNLYVFFVTVSGTSGTVEPVWPTSGTLADGSATWKNSGIPTSSRFYADYLYIITPGKQPVRMVEYQNDPTSLIEAPKYYVGAAGCSMPEMPMELSGQIITPNLNGYFPSAGRAYCWTLYNPNTLQESSPAPFVGKTRIIETDNSNMAVTINGSFLYPLPPPVQGVKNSPTLYSSYQSYYLAITEAALVPAVGQGYTCIRVYATKDGGSIFYLANTLYDNNGNQITNGDGSIPIVLLQSLQTTNGWQDYAPVPEAQALQNSVRVYEGGGPINLAPDPVNLGAEAWTQTVGTAMYVAAGTAPDGANAFQVDGPQTAKQITKSNSIAVTHQLYYFEMFVDNTGGTGGFVGVKIITPSGAVLLSKQQTDATAGTVSGTFTPSTAQKRVQIEIYFSTGVTVAADASIVWGDPVLQAGGSLNTTPTNYPTTDQSLVFPAPVAFANNPPPVAAMGVPFLDAMFFLDWYDRTKIWFTQQGQYEKVPVNNFVRTTTNNGDQVLEMLRCFDRLIIGKGRSVEQITSYPPGEPASVDPQHGVLAYRASLPYGSDELALLTNGLNSLSLVVANESQGLVSQFSTKLVGDDIKPLIDTINPATLSLLNFTTKLPSPAVLNKLDLYLLAYAVGAGYNDNVLMRYVSGGGYSRLTALPNGQQIVTLRELQTVAGGTGAWPLAGNGSLAMVALCVDAKAYVMFAGTQDGTVAATVVTQSLPTPADIDPLLYDTTKTFQFLWVEGDDLANWQVYYTTDEFFNDDGTVATWNWGPFSLVNNELKLGGVPGQLIAFKFVHNVASAPGVTPLLTYMNLTYTVQAVPN